RSGLFFVLRRRRERLAGYQRAFRAVVAVGHHADPHSPAIDVESLAGNVAPLRMIALTGRQADLCLRHRRPHEAQRGCRTHVRQRADRHASCDCIAVHCCPNHSLRDQLRAQCIGIAICIGADCDVAVAHCQPRQSARHGRTSASTELRLRVGSTCQRLQMSTQLCRCACLHRPCVIRERRACLCLLLRRSCCQHSHGRGRERKAPEPTVNSTSHRDSLQFSVIHFSCRVYCCCGCGRRTLLRASARRCHRKAVVCSCTHVLPSRMRALQTRPDGP